MGSTTLAEKKPEGIRFRGSSVGCLEDLPVVGGNTPSGLTAVIGDTVLTRCGIDDCGRSHNTGSVGPQGEANITCAGVCLAIQLRQAEYANPMSL